MPICYMEKKALERLPDSKGKQSLSHLYDEVEWGGLDDKSWRRLHFLEQKLNLTNKRLKGCITFLSK